jgi:putative photosynthetic complex assembly protein
VSYIATVSTLKPKLPGILVGTAIASAFVLVALGPNAVGGRTPPPSAPLVAERMLTFTDMPDHGVAVMDHGTVIATFEGEQGFLRGILRGLNRGRKMNDIPPTAPFRLSAYADGRLVLRDPSTGTNLEMNAYGATNEGEFANLLPIPGRHS